MYGIGVAAVPMHAIFAKATMMMAGNVIGFGGGLVDRRVGQELLKVIAPLGVEASLPALKTGLQRRRSTCRPVPQAGATGA